MTVRTGLCVAAIILCAILLSIGCGQKKNEASTKGAPVPEPRASAITVDVKPSGPVVITTSAARFEVSPSGYVHAALLKDGHEQTLEDQTLEGQGQTPGDYVVRDGKREQFNLDFSQAKVGDATGKLGIGKHITIPAQLPAKSSDNIRQTLEISVYDDFPNLLLTSSSYTNTGNSEVHIENIVEQQHRFNSHETKEPAYDMWSYQGSSYDWGEDAVLKLTKNFSRPNVFGAQVKGGYGGGIPVVAFWNANVGEAIGHVETLPLSLSMPVRVESDGRVSASVTIPANATLKAGETYSTPRTFLAVYSGDFYKPLRIWSSVLQKEGWELPKPSNEAYNVSWCGWGYESDVTPAQMLGTIPKLKEFGIKWATLDDRWFDTYGDWNPRSDTFPGDAIKKMVDDFHKQGELVQLWWLPLAAEDGQGRYESHKYTVSNVAKEHPDWFILDKNGKHARITRDLGALCPAVPEVQAYYKQLTEKFIRDWGFDGSKLDNIYSVPMCYNPAHHHKSPQDSVNAMADVYKTIFETTRSIKPESVTQSCPCGTPPSLAWLPYIDQAVTADPVGAVQVRRRIKMYKALLGPEAAVYGDHVELSAMTRVGKDDWSEHGSDFASTIGTGGVVGTKFVWPDPAPKFKAVNLTAEKEAHWKKWIGIYNEKMLSKGDFRDLYVYGYDVPEAYAIEKDGKMYYAFFAPTAAEWKGEVELRGLKAGSYHVVDYADGKDLGTVEAKDGIAPKLAADFKEHWLLEVSP
ncbi:MAG TPA: glycoside hydrolase family 36 protein [Candidatus Sulfotelmatobacter sp.]|jgi:alpha-galactosidase